MLARLSAPAALAALMLLALSIVWRQADAEATNGELTVVSTSGKHSFKVEVVSTPEKMAQGLMYRKSLPEDAGMLFDYGRPQPTSFWMKNTLIPLDMIFIAADGRIVNIHERAVPLSLDPIPSQGPVRGVLEVNGGTVAKLGIKPGDRVLHPIFGAG